MEKYKEIWEGLQERGYSEGDNVMYFDLVQVCNDIDIDPNDVNLDKLNELYQINIG